MRKLRKPLSWLLAVCMLFSLLPGTALAADPDPAPVADTTTYTDWEDLFGVGGSAYLTTKDIGRIWTDKSVSTQDITLPGTNIDGLENNTVKKEADADFLVALSGLGSAATIVDQTAIPTDTILVLDMSPKMQPNVNEMVTAANAALRNLLTSNPYNRVGVVVYDNTSATILPLDRYTNYDNGGTTELLTIPGNTITSHGIGGAQQIPQNSFSFDGGTYRNYQVGLHEGMYNLANAQDVTGEISGQTVLRVPVIISMASGTPERGRETFVGTPDEVASSGYVNPYNDSNVTAKQQDSYVAQAFLSLLTAAYSKKEIANNYTHNGESRTPYVYTVGVGDLSNDSNEALANVVLNPSQYLTEDTVVGRDDNNLNDALTSYNNGSVQLIRSRFAVDVGSISRRYITISRGNNATLTLDDLKYNDGYFAADNVSTAQAWNEIFDKILTEINTAAPTSPTETPEGAPGTGGESGFITFTDELGPYMKVVGAPTVLYGDHAFTATTNDNGATYTFTGTVEGNEIYGEADLSDLELTVTTGGDTQTLTWKVPASLIPLRTVTATTHVDGDGHKTYSIQQNQEAYPIRLFYSVDRDETVTFDQDDNEYLIAHSKDGTTSFYSNAWDAAAKDDTQYGTATAVFTPADSNAFYHYTEDTPLYVPVSYTHLTLPTNSKV